MTAAEIVRALGGRWYGSYGTAKCPVHDDRSPSLSIRDGEHGVLVKCFAGCDRHAILDELRRNGLIGGASHRNSLALKPNPKTNHAAEQLRKARWLWQSRKAIDGSPAERYLRDVRRFGGSLPATLGFLPPQKSGHHPALVAAFGMAGEIEPGTLAVAQVRGVHLTFIRTDGSGKADVNPNKIMVGPSAGWPIVLAPPNDGLALWVCEGIETGLSLFEATSCGVWAAGAAGRMPALADRIPGFTDCTTIAAENDEAGRRFAQALAERLRARGMHCEVWLP